MSTRSVMEMSGHSFAYEADEESLTTEGFIPVDECPCARLRTGKLQREHVRSLDVLHGEPCEQAVWSMERPCQHFAAEFRARLRAADAPSIRSISVVWSNGTVEVMRETEQANGLAVWRSRHATAFVSEGTSQDADDLAYEGPF